LRNSARSYPSGSDRVDVVFERHLAAYRFCRNLVEGARVIDVGCGEGYGAACLAERAAYVLGVDGDKDIIRTAGAAYGRENLRFTAADCMQRLPVCEAFDVVVSMQTIEHMADDTRFLETVRELLAGHGVAVISTPNRLRSAIANPLHYREYAPAEFEEACREVFSEVLLYGVFGDHVAERLLEARRRPAKIAAALGFARLQSLMPKPVALAFYSAADALVRKVTKSRKTAKTCGCPMPAFHVKRANTDVALDLIAVCGNGVG